MMEIETRRFVTVTFDDLDSKAILEELTQIVAELGADKARAFSMSYPKLGVLWRALSGNQSLTQEDKWDKTKIR